MDTTARNPADGRRLFRINLWLHRWASLIATPFFLVLCITGAILIFRDEIDEALGYVPQAKASAAAALPLAQIVEAAQAAAPSMRPLSAFIAADHPERTVLSLAPIDASRLEQGTAHFFDSSTGAALGAIDFDATPTGFLFELHAKWFLGLPGELFGGLVALLVLVSLISGLIVYAPYVRKLVFGMIRRSRGGGSRLVQLDLHNFIGVIVLGWALTVSATGIFLAFGTLAEAYWQATELKAMAARTPVAPDAPPLDLRHLPVSIDAAIATARTARPGRRPFFMVWPGTEFSSPRHYTILMAGTHPWDERLFDVVLVDASSAALADARALPWYLKLILISEPLHFGDYGGLPLKLLWVLASLLTLFITGNGAWLWWRGRHRPVRRAAVEARA